MLLHQDTALFDTDRKEQYWGGQGGLPCVKKACSHQTPEEMALVGKIPVLLGVFSFYCVLFMNLVTISAISDSYILDDNSIVYITGVILNNPID